MSYDVAGMTPTWRYQIHCHPAVLLVSENWTMYLVF